MTPHQHHRHLLRNLAGTWLCCALLMGCSVKSGPALRTEVNAGAALTQIELIAPEAEQTQRLALHNAIESALSGKGVALTEDAPAIGEVAIATSSGAVGLYAGEAKAPDDNARPIAEARKQRWYDACKASRVKASLAVFDRASGNLIKRSEVEGTMCEGDLPPIDAFAQLLAAEVTGR